MTLSISRKMIISAVILLAALITLFIILNLLAVDIARDSFIQSKMEQVTSISTIKKAKIEDFFEERQRDMNILIKNVENLRHAAFEKLAVVRQFKKAQIETYLEHCLVDIKIMSEIKIVTDALFYLSADFKAENGNFDSVIYQYHDSVFRHSLMRFNTEYNLKDLYLVNTDGDIVYSASRGKEMGQNLISGKLKDTSLGQCFRKGLDEITICDFELYGIEKKEWAAFIASPVKRNNELIGAIVLQLSIEPLKNILKMSEGMGESGEIWLMGNHKGKISFRCGVKGLNSQDYKVGDEIDKPYIKQAFSEKALRDIYIDNSGKPFIVDAVSLNIKGLDWVCISRMEIKEAVTVEHDNEDRDFFSDYISEFGYYDLFLTTLEGKIFYTVKHESDYDVNILEGEYADTGLGKVIRKVIETGKYAVSDYELYGPGNNEPASFIAQPLICGEDIKLIVALQLPISFMNEIMKVPEGMGKSGKTYLVGSDNLMRSDIPSDMETHSVKSSMKSPSTGAVKTEPVKKALEGKKGSAIALDYKGNPVITAYMPVKIANFTWALIAEISKNEIISDSIAVKNLFRRISKMGIIAVIFVSGLILFILLCLIFFLKNLILKPLDILADTADRMADYDLTIDLKADREDEIGRLISAAKNMIVRLREIIFTSSNAAEKLSTSAEKISGAMEEQAAAATEQSATVSEISSTMEELSATSAQIANNSNTVVKIASSTLAIAQGGTESVEAVMEKMEKIDRDNQNNIKEIIELGRKSEEINKVMGIINNIAYQTKLIAFNAALEASGAGEAGKRFGVVASEIRRLADNVTESTGEIENKIREIQEASNHMIITSEQSSKGIQEGLESFSQTFELFNKILVGTGDTTNAAKQISMATQQQKSATDQVVIALRDIVKVSEQTSISIGDISIITKELLTLSDDIRELMEKFILPDDFNGKDSGNDYTLADKKDVAN